MIHDLNPWFITFHNKFHNNQIFTSQFINCFLTIADSFIVMSAAEVNVCFYKPSQSLVCIHWDPDLFNITSK